MPRPRFEPEQEVRFAVVMYGGVSLAIYINGVAQELFRLVRATAPEHPYDEGEDTLPTEPRAYFADAGADDQREKLRGSEQVYRELGQWLGIRGLSEPAATAAEPPPVRTRFVVDIVSGTSAGGINGILLAKAIANQSEFGCSEKLWLDIGDIDQLLRGKDSWGDIPPAARRAPESLLNGYRLYSEARKALAALQRTARDPGDLFKPAYAEQLELAVTATDLAGLPQPIRLGPGRRVLERVHRKVLRFEYGRKAALGEDLTEFGPDDDVLLGFAARATSSFPFAFEPVKLADLEPLGDGYDKLDLRPWFPGYGEPADAYFADGGYLDNKPFSYATQALRRRRADLPVVRELIYIEPDPAPDRAVVSHPERPDVYQNAGDALAGLPRFEPIRQDIADVAERNRAIERLREIELDAELAIEPGELAGPAYVAYAELRRRTVLDQLANWVALLRKWEHDDERRAAVRQALRVRGPALEPLDELDPAYRQRRLSFLQDRVNDLLRPGERAASMVAVAERLALEEVRAGVLADEAEKLRRLKLELNKAHDALRHVERAPVARRPERVLDPGRLKLFGTVAAAAARLEDDPEAVDALVAAVRALVAPAVAAADAGVAAALDSTGLAPWLQALLREYHARFEAFDMITLPLAFPDLGEANAVAIRRISPLDAPCITPFALHDRPVAKLAGVRIKHFGAFLERDWRENDILWGRLDAAEVIFTALVPEEEKTLRDRLRVNAQAAILRELEGPARARYAPEIDVPPSDLADEALVTVFRQRFRCPDDLPEGRRRALAGRSLAIAARVLAEPAGRHHVPRAPLLALGYAGPVALRAAGGVAAVRARVMRLLRRN